MAEGRRLARPSPPTGATSRSTPRRCRPPRGRQLRGRSLSRAAAVAGNGHQRSSAGPPAPAARRVMTLLAPAALGRRLEDRVRDPGQKTSARSRLRTRRRPYISALNVYVCYMAGPHHGAGEPGEGARAPPGNAAPPVASPASRSPTTARGGVHSQATNLGSASRGTFAIQLLHLIFSDERHPDGGGRRGELPGPATWHGTHVAFFTASALVSSDTPTPIALRHVPGARARRPRRHPHRARPPRQEEAGLQPCRRRVTLRRAAAFARGTANDLYLACTTLVPSSSMRCPRAVASRERAG